MDIREYKTDDIIKYVNEFDGFAQHSGIVLLEAHDGIARGKIDLKTYHMNPIGSAHGGLIFSLADTVAGVAAHAAGKYVTTLSSQIYYLKAAFADKSKVLYADAKPVRLGRHVCVMEVMVSDDRGTEIAKVTIEFYVLKDLNAE